MHQSLLPIVPSLAALCVALTTLAVGAADRVAQTHTFKKIQLSTEFWSEGAHIGDFNKDGKMDVASGPYWYAGPDFKAKHEIYPATRRSKSTKDGKPVEFGGYKGTLGSENEYSDNFTAYTQDFNGDGWTDYLVVGFPGAQTAWFENPKNEKGHWKRHVAAESTDNESPMFADLTGDGKAELIFHTGGHLGYATPDPKAPTAKWAFHKISAKGGWQRFTHGIGIGDVNGDGKIDFLMKEGWWQQPASLESDPEWAFHPASFGAGGAQMYTYDVNADGRLDVITSLAAHGYGLAWFEQLAGKDDKGHPQFKQHTLMGSKPEENKYGVKFSQLHAIDLVDMDGDGLKDIVTGKRIWAHGPGGDAEPNAPAVLYWFQLTRDLDKNVHYIPHLIDDNSGIGTQVLAADINGDKLPDVIVGNKNGTFVHLHALGTRGGTR